MKVLPFKKGEYYLLMLKLWLNEKNGNSLPTLNQIGNTEQQETAVYNGGRARDLTHGKEHLGKALKPSLKAFKL